MVDHERALGRQPGAQLSVSSIDAVFLRPSAAMSAPRHSIKRGQGACGGRSANLPRPCDVSWPVDPADGWSPRKVPFTPDH
jgi:hypothetical protein